MQFRRHHLIEEAKAELDVVYEEVKRAENRLFALEREYGERIAEATHANSAKMPDRIEQLVCERDRQKSRIDVPALYYLEKAALERFSVLTAAFSTVCVTPDPARAARKLAAIVFRPGELGGLGNEVEPALRDFVQGLRAYATEEASGENDRKVRESWAVIETTLRDLGRAI